MRPLLRSISRGLYNLSPQLQCEWAVFFLSRHEQSRPVDPTIDCLIILVSLVTKAIYIYTPDPAKTNITEHQRGGTSKQSLLLLFVILLKMGHSSTSNTLGQIGSVCSIKN